MNCLFCKIVAKEIPGAVVYEDDAAVGILDIHPRAPGHTMVLPRHHAETVLELPEQEIPGLFRAVREVTAKLKRVLHPDGFTIGINHGSASGQVVEHLHVHVIPRWRGDGGGSVHAVVNNPPKESVEQIKEKLNS